ncbi:MAG: hypothetical protein HY425_02445 [Candidatus Levybacteria bacterium]|nr:hypothetical protein [Candidatus Levybacteria bacterium]
MRNLPIGLLICLFVYLSIGSISQAAGLSLGVDPPIIEINAIPPSNKTRDLTIKNLSNNEVTLQIQIKPFKAKGENNGIEYLNPEDFPILKNIQILDNQVPADNITLEPSQEKKLTLSINISKDINASDYYFLIIFISKNNLTPTSNTSLNQLGIASNILLSVGNSESPNAVLEEFSSGMFFEKGPVPFAVRLRNKGNHFIKPKGEIAIKNMFGQHIGNIDLLQTNILSNSTRTISGALWKEDFLLGYYTATLNLSLSDDGPVIVKSVRFFTFPFGTAIMIAAIVILLLVVRKKIEHRYNTKHN